MKITPPFSNFHLISISILLQIHSSLANYGCPGFENVPNDQPPKFKLSKLPNKFVQEMGRDVLINGAITPIHLDCWASYPIDLTFSGHLTNQKAEVRTSVSGFTRFDGVSAHCYHINLTLTTYKEITGNYSCFAVDNEAVVTSRFVFSYNPPSSILLQSNQTVTLTVIPGQKFVTLPCAISNPKMSKEVQLLKGVGNDSQWVLESKSLKYDPKIGFNMELSPPFETQLGFYQCQVGSKDNVKINLVDLPNLTVYPMTTIILNLKKGDRLIVECLSKNVDIFLKSTPELLSDNDASTTFNNKNFAFYKSTAILITKRFDNSQVGKVECIRKSDNRTLYQWQYRVSNEVTKPGILDPTTFLNSCPPPSTKTNSSSKELNIVFFECDNWIACKISQCLRNDSTCVSNNNCNNLCMPNGIIQCPSNTGVHAEIFFTGFNNVKYTNWRYAKTENILRIVPTMETPPTVSLKCEGTSFVLAGGFKWAIHLMDGTIVEIDKFANETTTKETWGETKSILRNTLTFSKRWKLLSNSTINAFICSAPLWNSTQWINQTINMNQLMLVVKQMEKPIKTVPKNFSSLPSQSWWTWTFPVILTTFFISSFQTIY